MGAERLAVFGYGSLVNRASAAQTLGRPVERILPATLRGWRRRWSLLRDNPHCEKTFATGAGEVPDWVLTLNVERSEPEDRVNGVLIEISEHELERLDIREVRYDRVDVGAAVEHEHGELRVITYTAAAHHALVATPAEAVILQSYAEAVEEGFRELSHDALAEYREQTGDPPVPIVPAKPVRHDGGPHSPARW